MLGAAGGSLSRFWRGLDRVDTLWIFGPHPFAVAFVILGAVRGKRILLGVRQDERQGLPGASARPALGSGDLRRPGPRRHLPTTCPPVADDRAGCRARRELPRVALECPHHHRVRRAST